MICGQWLKSGLVRSPHRSIHPSVKLLHFFPTPKRSVWSIIYLFIHTHLYTLTKYTYHHAYPSFNNIYDLRAPVKSGLVHSPDGSIYQSIDPSVKLLQLSPTPKRSRWSIIYLFIHTHTHTRRSLYVYGSDWKSLLAHSDAIYGAGIVHFDICSTDDTHKQFAPRSSPHSCKLNDRD